MPGERRIPEREINLFWILSITLLIFICDQVSKQIIQNIIPLGTSTPVIKNIFHLTLVFNKGAAFGIFKTQSAFFITVGIAAVIFMMIYLPRIEKGDLFVRIAFALIFGGVLGNLVDRLRFGYVVDFLDFRIWPVFNIADSAITVGAVLICIRLIKRKA